MSVTVKLRHFHIAPRKARLVADVIRGKKVTEAENQLKFTVKKGAEPFQKLLKSGVATAENDFNFEKDNLYLSEVRVDEGPTLKRTRARARGAFHPINKRTSHLTISLDQIEKREKEAPKEKKGPEVVKEGEVEEIKKEEDRREERKRKKEPEIQKKEPRKRKIFRRKAF